MSSPLLARLLRHRHRQLQINGGRPARDLQLTGGVTGQSYDRTPLKTRRVPPQNRLRSTATWVAGPAATRSSSLAAELPHRGQHLHAQWQSGGGAGRTLASHSGLAQNSFTLNGTLQGGSNDQGDVFQVAGLYGTVHMSSGTGVGGDTYEFSGGVQGSFVIQAPNSASRIDTLDFSTLNTGATVHLAQTSPQQVAPGLTLQLSDSGGFSNVIGSAFDDTIYGNSRSNVLQGLSRGRQRCLQCPGWYPTARCRLCFWISKRPSIKPMACTTSILLCPKGVTPLHNYSQAERQAILTSCNKITLRSFKRARFTSRSADDAQQMATPTPTATLSPSTSTSRSRCQAMSHVSVRHGDGPGQSSSRAARPPISTSATPTLTGTASIQVNGILGEPLQPRHHPKLDYHFIEDRGP